MSILVSQRWTRAPQVPVALRPEVARDAVVFVVPSAWRIFDMVKRVPLVASGGGDFDYAPEGLAFRNSGGANEWWESTGETRSVSTTDFTIEMLIRMTAAPSLSHVFGIGAQLPSFGTNQDMRRVLCFGGASSDDIYFWGGGIGDWDTGVRFRTDGSLQHIFFTATGGTIRLYRDGVQAASTTTPALIAVADPTYLAVGSRHAGGASSATFRLMKGSIRNRALTAQEVAELTLNPWLDFVPQQRLWLNAAAAAARPRLVDGKLVNYGLLVGGLAS